MRFTAQDSSDTRRKNWTGAIDSKRPKRLGAPSPTISRVIADRRGWQYTGHADAHTIAGNLAREEGNPEITRLYDVANKLHTNFYIDRKTPDAIRADIEEVKTLLEILRSVE